MVNRSVRDRARAEKGEAWAKIEEEKKKKGTTTKAWRLDARGKIDIGIAS
jgi:hypothetical protein